MHLDRESSLAQMLTGLHQNKDERVHGIEVDKNRVLEKQSKQLVDEIFSAMRKKGLINNTVESQLDQIEKLQLIRKYSKN
jgi:hypothetical protein